MNVLQSPLGVAQQLGVSVLVKVDSILSMLMPLSRGRVDEATNQIPSHAERDLSRVWF